MSDAIQSDTVAPHPDAIVATNCGLPRLSGQLAADDPQM